MKNTQYQRKKSVCFENTAVTTAFLNHMSKLIKTKSSRRIPIRDVVLRESSVLNNHPIDRSVTGRGSKRFSSRVLKIKLKTKSVKAESHYGVIGFAGGDTNLYAYVGGSPMSYVDPTGWIRYNNKAPVTVPVEGDTLKGLQCVESCLQKATNNPTLDLLITGGAETKGHSKNSHHFKGEACDIAQSKFNKGLTNDNVFTCAKQCGFGAGQFESFTNQNRDHWHLQITPGNGVPGL